MKRIALAVSIALSAAALVMLGGCGSEQKKDKTAGTAGGEILPGTASDAMLPLDTVRSQPPLAPKVEGSGKPGAKADAEASDTASDAAPEAAAAPEEPAAAPSQ